MKNSKEALEGAYNNALDLILNKKLKEGEKLLEKIYGSGNMQENHRSTPISSILPYTGLPTVLGKCGTKTRTAAL